MKLFVSFQGSVQIPCYNRSLKEFRCCRLPSLRKINFVEYPLEIFLICVTVNCFKLVPQVQNSGKLHRPVRATILPIMISLLQYLN